MNDEQSKELMRQLFAVSENVQNILKEFGLKGTYSNIVLNGEHISVVAHDKEDNTITAFRVSNKDEAFYSYNFKDLEYLK